MFEGFMFCVSRHVNKLLTRSYTLQNEKFSYRKERILSAVLLLHTGNVHIYNAIHSKRDSLFSMASLPNLNKFLMFCTN